VRSPLVVAPAMEDLRRAALQPRRTRPWFGQVASRRIGPGTEFWGVREYVAGDEVRRINWKASARLERLFTNEYEGERSGDGLIVLITPLKDRDALTAVIELAARGYDIAIVSPSALEIERRIRPDTPEDQMAYRILAMERANRVAQLRRVAQVVDWDPATPLALALRRMTAWPRRA